MRPALAADINRGAQPDVFFLEAVGTHLAPPVDVVWQPLLKRALKLFVACKINVVRNAVVKIHVNSINN